VHKGDWNFAHLALVEIHPAIASAACRTASFGVKMARPLNPEVRLLELQNRLFYQFKDPENLLRALSHKSFANEGRQKGQSKDAFVKQHNERLEFLGDSVLGLIISDILCERFPDVDEGKLSKMRSSLVKEETLAKIARKLALGPELRLGKGEESTQGRDKDSILSSAYEAVLGAIYLDGGFGPAYAAAEKHFEEFLNDSVAFSAHDTKTQLQELCQSLFHRSPRYEVVGENGPDHEKEFEVMVSMGKLQRFGKGRNKKEAEQSAARFLLDHLKEDPTAHA
jgi:ribonuclease-3